VMADRADWEHATRHQRHLAVAADAELRRRHPGRHYPPQRSAEPGPLTQVLPGAEDSDVGGVHDADEEPGNSGGLMVVVPGLVGEVPG